jgi:branched-chain amino acid transport system substrate-binding protein
MGVTAALIALGTLACTSAPAASPTAAPSKPAEAAKPADAKPAAAPTAAPAAKPAEPAAKAATGTPIKIGVMHSTTGPFVFEGVGGNEGLKLYWDSENNQVAGRPVQFIFEDTEGKPDVALTKVRKLAEQDQVQAVVGPIGSNEALAIRDYIHGNRLPLVLGYSIAKELTQEKGSPYLFRAAGSLQLNSAGGWYAAKKLNYKRAIMVSTDYAAGRDAAALFKQYYEEAGGKVTSEIYIPLGATDVAPYITQLRSEIANADVVAMPLLIGATASQFVKAYTEFGLKSQVPMFPLGVSVDEASTLPPAGEAGLGIMNFNDWSLTLDLPENKKFVEAFRAKYQKDPGQHHLYGYLEGRLIGEALKAVNGNTEDKDKFAEALGKVQFESPRGPFRLDEKHQAIVTVYIRKVDKVGDQLLNVVTDQVPNVDQFWKAPQ